MSINFDGMTGATNGATTPIGSQGYDPTPRLLNRHNGASGRPYKESLDELSLQLAARFAQSPSGTGIAAGDMHGFKGVWRTRYTDFKEPGTRGRTVALILSFCLCALLTTTAGLYFFHQHFFNRPAEPALSLSPFSAPVFDSNANVVTPLATEAYKAHPAAPDAASEPAPVVQADSALITVAQEDPFSDRERALEIEEIRELQTLLQSLDLSPGRADGILGPLTAGAVRRYEESRQLVEGRSKRELLERLRQEVLPPVSAAEVAPPRASRGPAGER